MLTVSSKFLLIALFLCEFVLNGSVDYKAYDLDSAPKDLVWCGTARDHVFILTETNSLYRSEDKGFSFKKMNDIMISKGKEQLDPDESEI